MKNGRFKDFLYGVKLLKLKHLTNGYIIGGTYLTIVGSGKTDNDRIICSGYKMDLKKLPYWRKLRNKKLSMIYERWDGKDGLFIVVNASKNEFKEDTTNDNN